MKKLLIILLIVTSCKAKKEVTSISDLKTSDTLIIKNERVVSPKGSYVLQLHEICDTITGEPKTITQYITRGYDSISLMIDANNGLKLTVENKESVISDLQSRIEKLNSELKQTKNTVITKYKVPRWAWFTLIFTVLSVLYVCNRIFKWIPFV